MKKHIECIRRLLDEGLLDEAYDMMIDLNRYDERVDNYTRYYIVALDLDNYKELNLNFDIEDSELDKEKIVKRKKIDTKPMNEEEAIIEMNLLGHDFFVFKNLDNEVCILYKRKDNKYGIIETK